MHAVGDVFFGNFFEILVEDIIHEIVEEGFIGPELFDHAFVYVKVYIELEFEHLIDYELPVFFLHIGPAHGRVVVGLDVSGKPCHFPVQPSLFKGRGQVIDYQGISTVFRSQAFPDVCHDIGIDIRNILEQEGCPFRCTVHPVRRAGEPFVGPVGPEMDKGIGLPLLILVQPEVESDVLVRRRQDTAVVHGIFILHETPGRLGHEPDIPTADSRDHDIFPTFVFPDHVALVRRHFFCPGSTPLRNGSFPEVFGNFSLKPLPVGLHWQEYHVPTFNSVLDHCLEFPGSPATDIPTLALDPVQQFR